MTGSSPVIATPHPKGERHPIRFLSVCSGVEAASQALIPLGGFKCVGVAEIEPHPCHVLAHRFGASRPINMPRPEDVPTRNADGSHRFPQAIAKDRRERAAAIKAVAKLPDHGEIPNYGDMSRFQEWPDADVDALCGGTPCFPSHTLIAAERGLVPISEIAVGDRVLTHEGRWRRVLAIGSKVAATIRVSGQGNSAGVITTAEHPFYARRKIRRWIGRENGSWLSEMSPSDWVPAADMKGLFWASPARWPAADHPTIGVSGREQDVPDMTDALAWLIGRWIGDGWVRCTNRRGYVLLCCGKHESEDLEARIAATGLRFSRSEERTTTRFQIAYRALALWLQESFGAGAAEKTIAPWVFGWKHRAALLEGYLSADGCRTENGWSITTVSASLGLGATLLAQSLGFSVSRRLVVTGRNNPKIEGRSVNERPFWQVRIYERARSSIEIEGHRWGLVRKVERDGESEVFNLEVEGDNSYVADGFVVHNCQSFSVAGLRAGLADPRGNLMLTFGAIAARLRPRWLLWENVPGVLSSDGGRDFASFLGLITGRSIVPPPEGWQNSGIVPGIADAYGVAWRVLDAQHVRTRSKRRAAPQRRRRVFLVGYLGDWTRAAAVLFDAESLRRDPAPRREAGQRPAPTISARPSGGGGLGTDFDLDGGLIAAEVSPTLVANGNKTGGNRPPGSDGDTTTSLIALSSWQANAEITHDHSPALTCLHEAPIVAHALSSEGFDATDDGTGKGTPIIPVAYPLPVAGTLSSNGDGPGKHGFGMGQQDWENGYAAPVIFDSKGSQVQTDESGAAPTLRAMTHADSHQNGGGQLAVAYSIQAGAVRENPASGPDGVGVQEGHAYTLEARQEVQAVVYDMCGREGGAQLERPHDTANLRAADGGSSRSYVAVAFSTEPHKPIGVRQGDSNGNATEADAGEILRGVRGALGEEAFSWWGLGILDMLQSPEILRSALHGRKLRPAPFTRRWVVDCALSRQEDRGAWAVQSLREAGGDGCASSGWEPSEQRAHELGAYLSELSQPGAQAERFMLDLWRASEGIGLLREALSAVQEARRPSCGEGQPAQTTWKVRRLTPDECEFLQGMPRGVTNIPWRGKAFSPDSPRYREIGNSWALNAIEWIGERMLIVDAWD